VIGVILVDKSSCLGIKIFKCENYLEGTTNNQLWMLKLKYLNIHWDTFLIWSNSIRDWLHFTYSAFEFFLCSVVVVRLIVVIFMNVQFFVSTMMLLINVTVEFPKDNTLLRYSIITIAPLYYSSWYTCIP